MQACSSVRGNACIVCVGMNAAMQMRAWHAAHVPPTLPMLERVNVPPLRSAALSFPALASAWSRAISIATWHVGEGVRCCCWVRGERAGCQVGLWSVQDGWQIRRRPKRIWGGGGGGGVWVWVCEQAILDVHRPAQKSGVGQRSRSLRQLRARLSCTRARRKLVDSGHGRARRSVAYRAWDRGGDGRKSGGGARRVAASNIVVAGSWAAWRGVARHGVACVVWRVAWRGVRRGGSGSRRS